MDEYQTRARVEWIVYELIQIGKEEDEIIDFFQECIDKVKKESINQ